MPLSSRHNNLKQDVEKLFAARKPLDTFWQESAEQFYPEMAEFTSVRTLGEEYADHLTTSYPLMARQELGNALSALLRPVNLDNASPGVWFGMTVEDERREDVQARRWLEWATGVQRRAMYDPMAGFVRATKEGDHCFATFGQCAIWLGLNSKRDALLFRNRHLKDVVWAENADGQVDLIGFRWKTDVTQMIGAFGRNRVASEVNSAASNKPDTKVEALHIVIATERYETRDIEGTKFRTPYVSVWLDVTNDHLIEEVGSWSKQYVIPRWVTIPGSQYASSPAVTAALPDARLIQAMTLTLQEAGEKFADPPMVATQNAVRSDIQLFSGGTTWVDEAYDEKMGAALRPLYEGTDGGSLNAALLLRADVRDMIKQAFFLDSLSLPEADTRDMTAFEVGQRISEWIRRAMPIFEPMEFEYNGVLCNEIFDLLLRNGAFGALMGPMSTLPQSLSEASIKFKFESPLHESADRRKGQKFLEAKAALVQAAELDPGVVPMLNATDTLKDVLKSIGVPAKWTRDDSEMEAIQRQKAEQEQAMMQMQGMGAGAEVAQKLGSAAKDFAAAGAA